MTYPDLPPGVEAHPCESEQHALYLAERIGGYVCVINHQFPKQYTDWFVAPQKEEQK